MKSLEGAKKNERLYAWRRAEEELRIPAKLAALDLRVSTSDLLSRLRAIREDLSAHLRAEEAPDGFFAELVSVNPSTAHRVEELREDHRRLEAAMAELCVVLEVGDAAPEALARGRDELVQHLRDHQQAEQRLLLDCYLQDTGGGS